MKTPVAQIGQPAVAVDTIMMIANNGNMYWALPREGGWQLMNQVGREMVTMPVPYEIIEKLMEWKHKKEEK